MAARLRGPVSSGPPRWGNETSDRLLAGRRSSSPILTLKLPLLLFLTCACLLLNAIPLEASGDPQTTDSRIPIGISDGSYRDGPYRIVAADVLEISFFDRPELDQRRTVGPDGQIYLPLIGAVQAAGRTVEELNRELIERYSQEMVAPQITLSVQEFSSMMVYVGGEVHRAGMLSYHGGLTLTEAIMQAGGFKKSGRMKGVILIRKGEDDRPEPSVVNVRDLIRRDKAEAFVYLQVSDIVFVPRKTISDVNLFVEQYFKANWPLPFSLGFNVTP